MAFSLVSSLKNLWPFSIFTIDELKISDDLVRKLSVPETTKRFVFAVKVPEHDSVIYILSAQNLSERSALDAEILIREIRPDAVVAQLENSVLSEIQAEEENELCDGLNDPVPTSSVEVLKRCFLNKFGKEKYEDMAGNLILKEIFGVTFHGNFLAAKRAASEIGSSFIMLESPFVKIAELNDSSEQDVEAPSLVQGLVSSLVPLNAGSLVLSNSKRFVISNDIQSQLVKFLSPQMNSLDLYCTPSTSISESQTVEPHEIPPFAQSIYPLLVDLQNIFKDLPFIERALTHARMMFSDVSKGRVRDTQILSEVYTFRIAVEGLRIALNDAARLPINKMGDPGSGKVDFTKLSDEDKSHALFAQSLQSQAKKFKTVLAVVDASNLAGLRRHWNTPVPPEIKDVIGELVLISEEGDGKTSSHTNLKQLLSDKPVVALGAGATAVLGVSSLPKVVPLSTFMKLITFKVPASLKLILTQTYKATTIGLSKTVGSSKVVLPGFASSGAKSTSALKAAASAEKIRAVTHSIIASAEKTSFSAMRTALYEIMRKRRVRPIGVLPWATFGCSVATCAGLISYGDGIECVIESLPAAPSIAMLGRGIRSLQEASQMLSQTDGNGIQKSVDSLMLRLKKSKDFIK